MRPDGITPPGKMDYSAPLAPRQPHVEVRFGEEIHDDYFWLRNKAEKEVIGYLEAENEYTRRQTERPATLCDETLWRDAEPSEADRPFCSGPPRRIISITPEQRKANNIRSSAGVRAAMTSPEEIVLDQNALADGRKFMEVALSVLSDDGNLLAYLVDFVGFRQYQLQIKDLRTGKIWPDTAERVTSVEWAADNRTLFLTTEDETTKRSDRLYRHELGTDEFELLYEEEDELFDISLEKSRDRAYVFLHVSSKDTTEVRFLLSDRPGGAIRSFSSRAKRLIGITLIIAWDFFTSEPTKTPRTSGS